MSRKNAFSNSLKFLASNLYRQFTGLLTAFFRPALLGPELFGLFSLLNMAPFYANQAHLGSRTKMRLYLEQKSPRSQQYISQHSLFIALTVTLVLVALLLVSSLTIDGPMFWPMIILAFLLLSNLAYEHMGAVAKAHHHFHKVSVATVIRYTATLLLSIVLIWFWGLPGAILALLIPAVMACIYLYSPSTLVIPQKVNFRYVKGLLNKGLPFMSYDLLTLSIRSIDKLVIFTLLGASALGWYALSVTLLGILINVPGSLREVSEQLLVSDYSNDNTNLKILATLTTQLRNLAFLLPIFIVPIVVLYPVFVTLVLPDFSDGITAGQCLIVGGFFLCLTIIYRGFMAVTATLGKANWSFVTVLVTQLILLLGVNALQLPLAFYAIATSIGFIVQLLALTWVLTTHFSSPLREFMRNTAIIWPIVIYLIVTLALNYYLISTLNLYLASIVSLLVFIVTYRLVVKKAVKQQALVLPTKLKPWLEPLL